MLRESALRFVRDNAAGIASDPQALWASFAELGWLALPLPEEHGGLGGTIVDVNILAEEFGRGLIATPYVSTLVLSAGLVEALGSKEQKTAIIPEVAAGSHLLALAHTEAGPRGSSGNLVMQATCGTKGWQLSGRKIAVIGGVHANTLIVSARVDDKTALFLVPRETEGVEICSYSMPGGGDAAAVTFKDVTIPATSRLGTGDVSEAIEAATHAALIALCAEAVGIMEALVDTTASYTNTREQFGKALTANQSVRFKLADMALALEDARSLTLRAALSLDAAKNDCIRAVSGAKSGVGRSALRVAELAIQLHGGMGVTEELTVGACYKRILAIDAMFGSKDYHLIRHARASGRLPFQKDAA